MVWRRKSRLGVLGDLFVFLLITAVMTVLVLWVALGSSDALRTGFAPIGRKVCGDTAPAPTATRFADLWSGWKNLGASSWSGALSDAFHNEVASTCTGVTDQRREAFLNAADRMARAARAALADAPPPGVRAEVDRLRIEQAQLANLTPAEQIIARFSLTAAEQLLVAPDSHIIENVAEVSGVNDVTNQISQVRNMLNASGLSGMMGASDVLGQIENQVTQQVTSKVIPTKLFLPHKVLLEPTPQLAILGKVKHIDGILVGLPITLLTEGVTGSVSAQRLWLTLELEAGPEGSSLTVKRWITRPL